MSLPLTQSQQKSLRGRTVIIGVTGGIAAYKMYELVSTLAQSGSDVTVLMTQASTRFVAPLTFQSLSGNPVYSSMWEHKEDSDPQHIALARRADAMLIAPCTMDMIASLVAGFANDPVSLVCSAIDRGRTPVLVAPSMNAVMWSQPATQRNLVQLRKDSFHVVEPGDGWQACRAVGEGRMTEPAELLEALCQALAGQSDAVTS